jgi:hypothetical protein
VPDCCAVGLPPCSPEWYTQFVCFSSIGQHNDPAAPTQVDTAGSSCFSGAVVSSRVPPDVAEFVLRRDGGCVAHRMGFGLDMRCGGLRLAAIHHRVLRGQGGKHTPENLIVLCDNHHVHAHEGDRDSANETGVILPPAALTKTIGYRRS